MQFSVTEGVWLLKNLQICETSFMDDPLNHFFVDDSEALQYPVPEKDFSLPGTYPPEQ